MASDEQCQREELLRRAVLAGDAQAWHACYEQAYAALDRYVLWRTAGRRDWADEVLQETWLVAVRRVRQFDPQQGRWLDWLRGIAANVLRNHLRRRLERQGRQRTLAAEPAQAEVAPEQVERAERVAAALAALPEHYEAVLRAKYLDNASVAEIAATSGQTPKAVESLLTRARQLFRETYEPTHGNGKAGE